MKKTLKSRGVTMIELLVTMTMIAIISSAVFGARGSIERKLALQRAAYQLSQDFREVQEMAMGSRQGSCAGGKNICGFGLYFESAKYTFFIDCAPNCSASNHQNDVQDTILRPVELEGDIIIQNTNPNNLSVLFSPPDPVAYINGTDWGTEAAITLGLSSETRQVKVNSAGKIEL